MANEAAKLTARTRVDNTGLTRGMQEADRIMLQGMQRIRQELGGHPLQVGVDQAKLRSEMQEAENLVRQRMHAIDQQVRSSNMLIGNGMGQAVSAAISPHLARLQHDQALLQRTAGSIGGGLGGMAFAGIIAGAGAAVTAIANVTKELYTAGAAAERLYTGFEGMTGGSDAAVAMLGKLREASRGTIDDMSLIQSANRAMMLGVTDDADTMARLLEVAIVRGRNLGVGAQQAFSDIVTGIGRVSPLILDNLGILTGGEQGMSAYAESIGKTSDALTDIERRQYLVNKVLEDTAVVADDAAAGMERYAAARANLKTEAGIVLAGALPDVSGAAAGAVEGMADQLRRGREAADAMGAYKDRLIEMQQAGVITGAQLGVMTQQWMILNQQVREGTLDAEQAALVMLGYFPEVAAALAEWAKQQQEARIQTELADGANIRKEQSDLRGAAAAREHAAAEAGLAYEMRLANMQRHAAASARAAWPGVVPSAKGGLAPGEMVGGRTPEDEYLTAGRAPEVDRSARVRREWDEKRERDAKLAASGGGGGGGISDAQRLAEQQAREFQSLVESVLQQTQVTGADVSATEHGVYQDKWDEPMRRMRADKSIPYYQQAETERQFYSGGMLDQVNWDAVVGDIARKQQEEAGRGNLINEAMHRAQEAGLTANYADVAGALGIRDDTVTGAEAAQGFAEGAKSVDVAANVVEQFVEGVRAQRQAMVDAGAEAMRAFLEGSDQAVTPDAGKKFARRIVPFIYDEFVAQGML